MKKNTKLIIINCFYDLLKTNNLKDISLRDITSKCDISVGTIYRHFKSRKDLIIYSFELSASSLKNEIQFNFNTQKNSIKTFQEILNYSKNNIELFKLVSEISSCKEFLDIDVIKLLAKNCLIYEKIKLYTENDLVSYYFIFVPLINFCLNNYQNSKEDEKIFIKYLLTNLRSDLWK